SNPEHLMPDLFFLFRKYFSGSSYVAGVAGDIHLSGNPALFLADLLCLSDYLLLRQLQYLVLLFGFQFRNSGGGVYRDNPLAHSLFKLNSGFLFDGLYFVYGAV